MVWERSNILTEVYDSLLVVWCAGKVVIKSNSVEVNQIIYLKLYIQ